METTLAFDDAADTAASGRPLGAISTLVSLFLLLVVFFVLLCSVGRIHTPKAGEVMVSVDHAFGGLPSRLGLLPVLDDRPTNDSDRIVRQISTLLTGFAPAAASVSDAGVALEVSLPPGRLFRDGSAALSVQARKIVPELAVMLSTRQLFRLSIELRSDGGRVLAASRAASLAAALYTAGCPPGLLQVGVATGEPSVRLSFLALGGAGDDRP